MLDRKYYIVDMGGEEWMGAGDAALVPYDTLDDTRKERVASGDTDKLFRHGGTFPVVYISDILDILDQQGQLKGLIDQCRGAREELDREAREEADKEADGN